MNSFPEPSFQGLMRRFKAKGIEVIAHEPTLAGPDHFNSRVANGLSDFKQRADIIVTNCRSDALADVSHKVCTCDLFESDL